jgi:hypothetical protein
MLTNDQGLLFYETTSFYGQSNRGNADFNGYFSIFLTDFKIRDHGFFGGYFTGLLDTLYLINNIYS